jgi:hypothetical protein
VARKSTLAQLNDVVAAIADELAKPGELKPARVNLLTSRIDTLKYLHLQEVNAEREALMKEIADLRRQIAELKAPTSPQTTPQSELDATVAEMLKRHAAQIEPKSFVTPAPTLTRSEPVTPRPVEYDEDLLT